MKIILVAIFVVAMAVILFWEDEKEFYEVKKVDLTKVRPRLNNDDGDNPLFEPETWEKDDGNEL